MVWGSGSLGVKDLYKGVGAFKILAGFEGFQGLGLKGFTV